MAYIRMLGSLAAEVDGAAVDLGGPRQRAVLAVLLAAHGQAVSVDRLIEDLWRGEPPPRAIASLQSYVSHLRRALEPGRGPRIPATVLVSAPPGYAIRLDPDDVDGWRFERLLSAARERAASEPARARGLVADALELWRGPALAEFVDEPWAAVEAARLEELRHVARELQVEVSLRTGAAAEAAPSAEVLTRQQPLREEGWRLYALALWASGRQAEALAALRRARDLFAEELGLDPGPALVDLEAAILAQRADVLAAATTRPVQEVRSTEAIAGADAIAEAGADAGADAESRAGAASPGQATARDQATVRHQATARDQATVRDQAGVGDQAMAREGATPPSPRPAPQPFFVGRDTELAELRLAAAQARAHGPAVALVAGEAGVGKSSLLGRLRAGLEEERWSVVAGRCPETEDAPPAWAWTEALRSLAEADPPGEFADAVAPLLGDEGGPSADAATGRFRLHTAVSRWLTRAATQRPLAVIIDDLHDADAETLAMLSSLATSLEGVPVLLVTAFRPAEGRPRLTETLAVLARQAPQRISLGGLAESDVELLLGEVYGAPVDPATVKALSERTGGNPFYVRESGRLLVSEGALVATSEVPEGVRDVLRRRTSRLPPAAMAVLRLAAVVGQEAEVEVLVDAADADEEGVLDACEAGLIAGLLDEPAPGRVRFVHALVRDTMYTDLSLLRRTRMHARVAESIRRLHPDDLPALAHHYARAATSETACLAVEYSVAAARVAERRYASDAEVSLLTQALAALDRVSAAAAPADPAQVRVDLMGQLLRAQVRAGDSVAARQTRQQAVELAERAGRDDLVIAAFTAWSVHTPWLVHTYGWFDDRAIEALNALLRRADLDGETRCRLLAALAAELEGSDDASAVAASSEAVELARAAGDPALLALALTARVRVTTPERDSRLWEELRAEIDRLGAVHDLPAYRWYAAHMAARLAAARNDPDRVREHSRRALQIARAFQMSEPESISLMTEAMLAHIGGRFEESERLYREAADQMARLGSPHAEAFRTQALSVLLVDQRRYAEALPSISPLLAEFPVAADGIAVALAHLGRTDEARAVRAKAPALRHDYYFTIFATLRAMAVVALGERAAAPTLIEDLMPLRDQIAGAASNSSAMRPVAYTLGDLYRMLGHTAQAREHYALAVEIARIWDAPVWLAEAEAALQAIDK